MKNNPVYVPNSRYGIALRMPAGEIKKLFGKKPEKIGKPKRKRKAKK